MSPRSDRPPGGSRQRVLGALRATSPQPIALPDLAAWTAPNSIASPAENRGATPTSTPTVPAMGPGDAFKAALEDAGAQLARIGVEEQLGDVLAEHAPYTSARRVVSGLDRIASRGEGTSGAADARALADVDVTVARGRFGVAENGAIWCDGEGLPHRAAYFLCQHLVLVVREATLVDTLHDAYERIDAQPDWCREQAWSGFIAGPSKTADIEQALVVGAHGPRSLLVVLVG